MRCFLLGIAGGFTALVLAFGGYLAYIGALVSRVF